MWGRVLLARAGRAPHTAPQRKTNGNPAMTARAACVNAALRPSARPVFFFSRRSSAPFTMLRCASPRWARRKGGSMKSALCCFTRRAPAGGTRNADDSALTRRDDSGRRGLVIRFLHASDDRARSSAPRLTRRRAMTRRRSDAAPAHRRRFRRCCIGEGRTTAWGGEGAGAAPRRRCHNIPNRPRRWLRSRRAR